MFLPELLFTLLLSGIHPALICLMASPELADPSEDLENLLGIMAWNLPPFPV